MSPTENLIPWKWNTLDECQAFAVQLARLIEPPMTIQLDGTLGAGKTQFTKFFAKACGANMDEITSPTFVLVHRYATTPMIYHLDAYRVSDEDEFLELGVEELFEESAITLVEWGRKFEDVLPRDRLVLSIDIHSDQERSVQLSATGPRSRKCVAPLQASRQ